MTSLLDLAALCLVQNLLHHLIFDVTCLCRISVRRRQHIPTAVPRSVPDIMNDLSVDKSCAADMASSHSSAFTPIPCHASYRATANSIQITTADRNLAFLVAGCWHMPPYCSRNEYGTDNGIGKLKSRHEGFHRLANQTCYVIATPKKQFRSASQPAAILSLWKRGSFSSDSLLDISIFAKPGCLKEMNGG